MASGRGRAKIIRQWGLIALLARHRRGLTAGQIQERAGISHSTLYRDLAELRDAGVPLDSHVNNGEARHTLFGLELPPLGPTPLQIAALRLARRALAGLDGTTATAELDKLLHGYANAQGARDAVSFAKPRAVAPELIHKLDRAIHTQRRTRIRYRAARATSAEWRTVDPLGLRHVKGHVYFIAYDDKREDFVPFKLDRLIAVDVLADKAKPHPNFDVQRLFARAVTAWTGEDVEVAVRLSPKVARFSGEYPLVAGQSVTDDADGGCVVRARVAGVMEAMRWVLSWGQEAEALEPGELREAVAAEVQGAARRYGARQPSRGRARPTVSHRLSHEI
jgi:predicted DNA-binding transcriptional regulator YafY